MPLEQSPPTAVSLRSPLITLAYIAGTMVILVLALCFVWEHLFDNEWGNEAILIGALAFIGILACILVIATTFTIKRLAHLSGYAQTPPRMEYQPLLYGLYIAIGYALIGFLYIFFSTHLARTLSISIDHFKFFELIKGYLFIGSTSVLLFIFGYLLFKKITHDAREIIAHKDALVEASKRATTSVFAASIAHDAGNVLASLRFCLELLKRSQAFEKEGAELFVNMERAVRELSALNKRLLETGQRGLSNEMLIHDVVAEVRGALGLARINQRAKYCQVALEGDSKLMATINPSLINEMVLNLVLNAADATENRGKITTYVYQMEGKVHIEVHDNGPGIPEENRQKIFEPFYTTKATGTGLGLLTVKACAEIHNGTLEVDRSPFLGGAMFAITFPMHIKSKTACAS